MILENLYVWLPSNRSEFAERLKSLSEIYNIVHLNLMDAYAINANYYSTRRKGKSFAEGDIIWRKNFVLSSGDNYFSKKLAPRFVQNIVLKKVSDNIYVLGDLNKKPLGRYHVKDIVKV